MLCRGPLFWLKVGRTARMPHRGTCEQALKYRNPLRTEAESRNFSWGVADIGAREGPQKNLLPAPCEPRLPWPEPAESAMPAELAGVTGRARCANDRAREHEAAAQAGRSSAAFHL